MEFFILQSIATQIKSFPIKKSVATMFVDVSHQSCLYQSVKFLFTESAICAKLVPEAKKPKITVAVVGVNSAMDAQKGLLVFEFESWL